MLDNSTRPAEVLGHGTPEHAEISDWITNEVHLLDAARLEDWYELLHPTLTYSMPVRLSLMPKDGFGFRDDMDYFMDDYESIKMRVDRLKTEMAWAEQPGRERGIWSPTTSSSARASRPIASAASSASPAREPTCCPTSSPGNGTTCSAARRGRLLLHKRTILLDQSVLKSFNLSIVF